MKFISQGQRIYREINEPLRINIDMVLVDVQPSDIGSMADAMAAIEKILSGRFEIRAAQKEDVTINRADINLSKLGKAIIDGLDG